MSARDGGPAFPFVATDTSNLPMQSQGMTLRDYFAAKAMHADLVYQGLEGREDVRHVAAMAYEMADAMLSERAS